jgi:hypothetical protein
VRDRSGRSGRTTIGNGADVRHEHEWELVPLLEAVVVSTLLDPAARRVLAGGDSNGGTVHIHFVRPADPVNPRPSQSIITRTNTIGDDVWIRVGGLVALEIARDVRLRTTALNRVDDLEHRATVRLERRRE